MKEIRVLFINPPNPQCGVHQYGLNLYFALHRSEKFRVEIAHAGRPSDLHVAETEFRPDCFIFNYHPGIPESGWYHTYARSRISLAVYHDGTIDEAAYRAIVFSDPTMPQQGKWYPIGRPLPLAPSPDQDQHSGMPIIGVNGFMGAQAQSAVMQILSAFTGCVIRLHLPFATYGDPAGQHAQFVADQCRAVVALHPQCSVQINHEFLSPSKLISWLQENDLNVYVRNVPTYRGISSVTDYAMASQKPMAINSHAMFRHLHNLNPSIQIEHNSLRTIMQNGIKPWKILLDEWAPQRICAQVEHILDCVTGATHS